MLLYETRGESKFYYSYDTSGTLYSVKYTLTDSSELLTYYFTHNSRGDIIGIYNGEGTLKAQYEYDSWGNVTSITDGNGNAITSATHIGNLNPFRYRGYYYDSETGLYYLMSRYYDPVTHRFINADGYFQSGGGILDANMSAYCANNPIIRLDTNGEFWEIAAIIAVVVGICTAVLSGCSSKTSNKSSSPRSDLASKPNLDRKKANKGSYNCYGNAIGKQTIANPSGYQTGDSTEKTFQAVIKDVGSNNVRRLTSVNDIVYDNENLVALKCGPMDYHFMVRVDGVWYNKPGTTPLISNESLSIVTADKWIGRYLNNYGELQSNPRIYYDDETIYFAIAKEWDVN